MTLDDFTKRISRVRERFAKSLPEAIEESIAVAEISASGDSAIIERMIVTHRKLHEICGIAPSIGFDATGKAARNAEAVLREPAKVRRELTAAEISALKSQLEILRASAESDLQSMIKQG